MPVQDPPTEGSAGLLFAIAAASAYASGPIWAAAAYREGLDWPILLTWRFGIAAALGWVIVFTVASLRGELMTLPRPVVAQLVSLGLLFVVNAATFYASLTRVPVALAVVVSHLSPVLIFFLSRRYGLPLHGTPAVAALILATVGAVLSVGGARGGADALGVALAFASTAVYAVWAMLAARKGGERRGQRVDGVSVLPATTVMFSGTALGFVALVLVVGRASELTQVPTAAVPVVIGFALVATMIGLLAWYEAARRMGVARTSIFTTVEPFVAIVLAFVFLEEAVVPAQVVGATLVVGAAVILHRADSPEVSRSE